MKLFNGKYEVIADTNQYVLRETIHYTNRKGDADTKYRDRFYSTLEQLFYRVLELEEKCVFNSKEWDDVSELHKALDKMEKKILEEVKKVGSNIHSG